MRRTSLALLSSAMVSVLALTGCSDGADAADAQGSDPVPAPMELSFLDTLTVADGLTPFDVPLGGLSGIDYDEAGNRFVVTSDDRSEKGPARFYDVRLPLDDAGHFASPDPEFTAMTVYRNAEGEPYPAKGVDPESIRLVPDSTDVLVSSEGDASAGLAPFVTRFDSSGAFVGDYPLPAAYIPDADQTTGVQNNLAVEGLTYSPDGSRITALTENALKQDGPIATADAGSPSRAVVFDAATTSVEAEYVYDVDPIGGPYPEFVNATGYTEKADRGASEMLAIDDTDYLVVERGLIPGKGNTVQVYRASTVGATDVAGKSALDGTETAMTKTLLFDFADTGENPDNIEGMSWGPTLEDGTRTLVLCADDNFNAAAGQHTKFHVLAVK